MDDKQIIDLFWQRDEAALHEASRQYAPYCFSIALRILGSKEDANECLNDTFLRAWNAIPPARPERLAAFLGKITRNLSLNRYQKIKAEKRGGSVVEVALTELEECVSSVGDVEKEMKGIWLTEALDRFLDELPEKQRTIWMQRYWYLTSIADIAADMGMSESNVKSILFRTRKKLKVYLEKEDIIV